jgi:hypothetical protein
MLAFSTPRRPQVTTDATTAAILQTIASSLLNSTFARPENAGVDGRCDSCAAHAK